MSRTTTETEISAAGGGLAGITQDPNQRFWDKAVELFNRGARSIEAIGAIWDMMPPPGELPTLATIVGAVYADTYWERTSFSQDKLASDLRAVTGHTDSDRAAAVAFQSWHGMLVRANMSDQGGIPRVGDVTSSPDVVLNGMSPLTVQRLIALWNTYNYTAAKGKNYTYGRAQSTNFPVPIAKATLRMYYSDAGFNPPPQSWVQLFTYDGNSPTSPLQGLNPGNIQPGERCANSQAFGCELAGPGHYCLISVVGTEFFTNDPLVQGGNWDTNQWIHQNGAAGWHNIDRTTGNRETLKFYNQDPRPERFAFEAHCTKVPTGTVVSLESTDAGLAYPVSSGEVTISQEYQVVRAETELPPNFSGTLQVRYQTPDGRLLPEGSAIDVHMTWLIGHGHQHYLDAANRLNDIGGYILNHPMTIEMGNYTFLGAE